MAGRQRNPTKFVRTLAEYTEHILRVILNWTSQTILVRLKSDVKLPELLDVRLGISWELQMNAVLLVVNRCDLSFLLCRNTVTLCLYW